jgi:hypothetical protein
MIEERARHELYRGVEELLGTDRADTLMSLLPPVGWADVTTKTDLRSLDDRIDSRFSRVDAQFSRVDARFTAIDARFTAIDARLTGIEARLDGIEAHFEQLEGRVSELESTLHRTMAQQTRTLLFGLVGAMLTLGSLCLGTIALAV